MFIRSNNSNIDSQTNTLNQTQKLKNKDIINKNKENINQMLLINELTQKIKHLEEDNKILISKVSKNKSKENQLDSK